MSAIEIDELTFKYHPNSQPVLDNITVSIPSGQWTTIIGHNGSGKSTLARLIDGLLPIQECSISVNGIQVDEAHLNQVRQQIGFVFQDPDNQFVGTTVADDVAFGLENHNIPRQEMLVRIKQALADVNMTDFADRQPSTLSGGQKQRVAIASALCLHPKILIFDEATSMLDPQGRSEILKLLARLKEKKSFTIVAISHNLNEAFYGDNVMVLDKSHLLAFGSTQKIMSNDHLFRTHELGMPFEMELKEALLRNGLDLPAGYQSKEQILRWLSQRYHLKK